MKNKLLIVTREQEDFYREIRRRNLPNLQIEAPATDEDIAASIADANIILANPICVRPFVNSASSLQWLQSTFTGVDALIHPELKSNYVLTNVRDAYGEIIAEYVFGYILFIEKEIDQLLDQQRNRQWLQKESITIRGKTMGVLGVGSIGRQIARVAKTFGMTTVGLRNSKVPAEHFDQVYSIDDAPTFYQRADYVVVALPQTNETIGIVNRDAFVAMKRSAIFFNVGRGRTVVEKDLVQALEQHVIRAAVIDVFSTEPLPSNSALWDVPNLFVTPHVSGYLNSRRIFDIFEENYRRFLDGAPLKYQIDFEKGY